MGYTKQTVVGTSWMAALRGVIRGASFIKLLFVARLLTPAQFGAYGVATLTLAFVEVVTETGVNVVLIQEDEQLFSRYLNSAWIVSIVRGLVIGGCIALFAPVIAHFFHTANTIPLLLAVSLVPIIKGFINPAVVTWQKRLEFHKEASLRGSIAIVGATSTILLALAWHSPMALIVGMILEAILEVVLTLWWITPRPRLVFHRADFGYIVSRGKWLTAAGVFSYLFSQLDDIVVGRRLGESSLGVYQMAYRVATLPVTEAGEVFNKVAFPVYAKFADDSRRLLKAYAKMVLVIAAISVPFALLLYLYPAQLVRLVLGPQWQAVVPLLPILGLYGALRAISNSSSAVFLAVKQQRYVMMATFWSVVVLAVCIIPFVTVWGSVGAAWATVVSTVITIPVITLLLLKVFRQTATNAVSA